MIPSSFYINVYFRSYDQKYKKIFLFSLYFKSLNCKYLKLTKLDITRFVIKLFISKNKVENMNDPLTRSAITFK